MKIDSNDTTAQGTDQIEASPSPATQPEKTEQLAPRGGAMHIELDKLRRDKIDNEATIAQLNADLTILRSKLEVEEKARIAAEERSTALAAKVAHFGTIEEGAQDVRDAYSRMLPEITMHADKNRQGGDSGVSWGHLMVKEERDPAGTVLTPACFAFRRTFDFELCGDTSYSKGSIESRCKGTIDLMLSSQFIGPTDSRTAVPSFAMWPPLFFTNAEGKPERIRRTLDVIVLVR
jgi:hypothetical protein